MPEQKIAFVIEARDAFSTTLERMGKKSLSSARALQQSQQTINQSAEESARIAQQSAALQADARASQEAQIINSQAAEVARTQKHHSLLKKLRISHEKSITALQQGENHKRLQEVSSALGRFADLAKSQGTRGFNIYKALSVGEALISAYLRASKAAASVPWPLGPLVAAAELARGLALARSISKQKPPAAHGGLDFIPREQTYLLNKGERVLSPNQNQDLTHFLTRQGTSHGDIIVQNMQVHILENATHIDSLLRMDERDLRELLAVRIYDAMNSLYENGVYPAFAAER